MKKMNIIPQLVIEKLFGLIVSHMERISTRKRNAINIVQCSKSLKTMILSKSMQDDFHII